MNVWNMLGEAATRWPARVAVREHTRTIDHATAARLARHLAATLRERGVRPGDRVACLMHNGADHLLAYFGVAAAGAILVSLNTRLSVGEQRTILAHAGARLLLHDDAHGERAAALAVAAMLAADAIAAGRDTGAALPLAAADEPAHLYYTSGTTGAPKGVVLTHRNVCTHARAAIAELSLAASDTWAHIAPMFHLADAWATFAITAVGGTHVFLPHFTAAGALDLLAQQRVTITNLVPTMLIGEVILGGRASAALEARVRVACARHRMHAKIRQVGVLNGSYELAVLDVGEPIVHPPDQQTAEGGVG